MRRKFKANKGLSHDYEMESRSRGKIKSDKIHDPIQRMNSMLTEQSRSC